MERSERDEAACAPLPLELQEAADCSQIRWLLDNKILSKLC